MKKFLFILFLVCSLTAVAQQKKVAVYMTGKQSDESNVLGDQIVTAFAKSTRYTAVERTASFLEKLANEQEYQRSGAVSDDEIARLGKQFGVNYVCVAQISDVFGEKYISARLIDVETAEIVNTHNVSGTMNSMSSCLKMASEIAINLTRGTFAEQADERRAAEEVRLHAEAEKRARIEAEERAKREAEEEKKRKIEAKKTELRGYLQKGYIIVKNDGQKWMVCTEPLKDISGKEVKAKKYYTYHGYSDWQIGNWINYCWEIAEVHSEIYHYLSITMPICENYQDYWGGKPEKKYIYTGTYFSASYGNTEYLDKKGDSFYYQFSGMIYDKSPYQDREYVMNNKTANALLVRKVR